MAGVLGSGLAHRVRRSAVSRHGCTRFPPGDKKSKSRRGPGRGNRWCSERLNLQSMNRSFGVHPLGCQSRRNTLKREHRTVPRSRCAIEESRRLYMIVKLIAFVFLGLLISSVHAQLVPGKSTATGTAASVVQTTAAGGAFPPWFP